MRRLISRVLYWLSLMAMEPKVRAIAQEVNELGMNAYETKYRPEVNIREDLGQETDHDKA